MNRRTRGRLVAIVPIAAAVLVTVGLCLAVSHGSDRCRRSAERVRGPASTFAQDARLDSHAETSIVSRTTPHRRGGCARRAELASSPTRASMGPDRHLEANRELRHHRRQRKFGRYALFMVLVLAWYGIGVAVMPWVATRAARRYDS